VNILLAPHGTRGDVQPMLALADALRGRGHVARFVAPTNFLPWLSANGFEAQSNGIDVAQELRAAGADLQSLRWLAHHAANVLVPRLFESVARASDRADLIVGSGVQLAAGSIAEWRDVPYAGIAFCPCAVPSSLAPPPTVRSQTLPPLVNWLLWQAGRPVANLALRGPINAGRAKLGLRPLDSVLAHLTGHGVIVAADRDLAPVGDDAPSTTVMTDAWIWDEPADLDPRMEAFLQLNPAPVYFGFGSMVSRDVPALALHALTAARALGRPAIFAGGWARLDRHVRDADDVLAVESVPHRLVFPRVALAVHHGGAGTTTAAARAGVPQVLLPHILDQYYWAHRVGSLGLGPRGLAVDLVNADVLSDRMSSALADPGIREAAATFAPAIASRNGVFDAVDCLEQLARSPA
jgi:vancomycin aglycone glucosyltransferase